MGQIQGLSKRGQLWTRHQGARVCLQVCSWLLCDLGPPALPLWVQQTTGCLRASPDLRVCDFYESHLERGGPRGGGGRKTESPEPTSWQETGVEGGAGLKEDGRVGGVSSQTACSGLLVGVPSGKSFRESHYDRPVRMPVPGLVSLPDPL